MPEHGKEKIKAGTTGQELKVQTTAWRGTRRKFKWLLVVCHSSVEGIYHGGRPMSSEMRNPRLWQLIYNQKKNAKPKLKTLLLGCQTVSFGVRLQTFRRHRVRSAHRELYTDRQSVAGLEYSATPQWERHICQAVGAYEILVIQKLAARRHAPQNSNIRNYSHAELKCRPKICIIVRYTKGMIEVKGRRGRRRK